MKTIMIEVPDEMTSLGGGSDKDLAEAKPGSRRNKRGRHGAWIMT